jgi:hypothetical protein
MHSVRTRRSATVAMRAWRSFGQVEALALAVVELHRAEQNVGVLFQRPAEAACDPWLEA